MKVLDFAPFRRSYVREFELSHGNLVNRIIKITHAQFACEDVGLHAGLVPGRNLPSCACRVTAVFNVAVEFFSKWPL